MNNNKTDELKKYSDKIIEDPNNSKLYIIRANLYIDLKDYKKALRDYNKAIKLDDKNAFAYYKRGQLYAGDLMKYYKALKDYDKAIELNNTNNWAYYKRGQLYAENLKEYYKALKDYDKAIELNDTNDWAYYKRGQLYAENLKEYHKALKDYDKAIELNDKSIWVYLSRGNLYEENLNKYDEAISDYNKAIELDDENIWGYIDRGGIYKNLKEYEKALSDYSKAIELNDKNAWGYYKRAILYKDIKSYIEALNDLSKVIELDDEFVWAYTDRGDVYKNLNEYEKALNDYSKAYELYGKKENKYMLLLIKDNIKNIQTILGHVPPELKNIHSLMELIKNNNMEENLSSTKNSFFEFIGEAKIIEKPKFPYFEVLRRWNSYTPIIADNYHISKGGGYFIKTESAGIVVDPGFNFIDNFKGSKHVFKEIDKIFITHAHNDHTADLESIITLLYKYNEEIKNAILNDLVKSDSVLKDNIEKIVEEEFERSEKRKKIQIYMTISTYKKHVGLFDLYKKNYYEITIIKSDDIIKIDNLEIKVLYSKHNDILSDRDSVGFMFNFENFALIYTGDTGFDDKIRDQYEQIKKECIDKYIVLLAHIGGFKDYENEYRIENFNYGKAFYKNHLGRLGVARLIEILDPNICILSEFGEEFKNCEGRIKLCKVFQQIYSNTLFFPADIGLSINTDKKVKVINSFNNDNKEIVYDFIVPENVGFDELGKDHSLYYYNNILHEANLRELLRDLYDISIK